MTPSIPADGSAPSYFGVYPAIVTDLVDSDQLGRVEVRFPWLGEDGDQAVRAWATLCSPSTPDAVHVSVRDDGPGIPEGRLEEAERDGRLGVASSIRGRVTGLGGTAEVSTGSFGTEWELTFPQA